MREFDTVRSPAPVQAPEVGSPATPFLEMQAARALSSRAQSRDVREAMQRDGGSRAASAARSSGSGRAGPSGASAPSGAPMQCQATDETAGAGPPRASSHGRVGHVEPHLTLRSEPDPRPIDRSGDPLEVTRLRFNDRVQIIDEGPGDWLSLRTDDGQEGYASRLYIFQNAPEPDARLYRTKSGDTALGIAQAHYDCGEWGADGRFYTNVLVNVNGGEGNPGQGIYKADASGTWQTAQVKADHYIWIPSREFARSLQGVVSSGSISYEAVETAKSITAFVAGYYTGLWDGLVDVVKDVVELVQLIWQAIVTIVKGTLLEDLKAFWEQITSIDPSALLAAFVDRWNHPDSWEKWKFRGWVIGFAIMLIAIEVLLAVVTGGAGNVARWGAKVAKLAKLDKLVDFLRGVPAIQKATGALTQVADGAGDELGDMRRLLGSEVEGLDAITDSVRRRIDGERGMSLEYSDVELGEIVRAGREQGLDDDTIEDLIYIGSREAKRIDADTLVGQMDFYVDTVQRRGFPAKFASLDEFRAFGAEMRRLLAREKVPTTDLRVQGSSLRSATANDVDLVAFVEPEAFGGFIRKAFSGKVKHGNEVVDLDGLSLDELQALAVKIGGDPTYNAYARTFRHAIVQGTINSKNELLGGLKAARRELAAQYPHLNIETISVQSTGSTFNLSPSMAIP